jgi:hypothetical protein
VVKDIGVLSHHAERHGQGGQASVDQRGGSDAKRGHVFTLPSIVAIEFTGSERYQKNDGSVTAFKTVERG